MEDKEKRIYEMAKEIAKNDCHLFDRCPKQPKHNCISQEPEIMLESSKHYITIATWLVDADYQKVGKDSVVLSREDYKRLKSLPNKIIKYMDKHLGNGELCGNVVRNCAKQFSIEIKE